MNELAFEDLSVAATDGWPIGVRRVPPSGNGSFAGRVFVCVHGFTQDHGTWMDGGFVQMASARGADVYCVDLRGHGLSRDDSRPFAWDLDTHFLCDLPPVLDHIKERTGVQRLVYCGHSLGGIYGLGYASRRDDLELMVAVASPFHPGKGGLWVRWIAQLGRRAPPGIDTLRTDHLLKMYRGILAMARTPVGKSVVLTLTNPDHADKKRVAATLERSAVAEPVGSVVQLAAWARSHSLVCNTDGYDIQAQAANVRCPLIYAYGALDGLCPPVAVEGVADVVPQHLLTMVRLERCSHMDPLLGPDVVHIVHHIERALSAL